MSTEEFKVLDDREHCLRRISVYLGSPSSELQTGIIDYKKQSVTIVPALIKMIEESYQNSIDEWIRTSGKFAKNISLSINNTTDGTEITVTDDGRGIPIELIDGKYRPLLAWTELRAGSNFDDSKRIGVGTNGMGISLTNIFSKVFEGKTCNGTDQLIVNCSDNMLNISHKLSKSNIRGTTVKFVPDLSRFGLTEFDDDHTKVLLDRFTNLAILYPDIQFSFNGKKIQFKNLKQVAKNFHETAISYETDNVKFIFAPSGVDEEFSCHSYVNGIYVKNGGSHVDFVMNKVIESLREYVRKKHKIDVLPNSIRQHLLFASWVSKFPALSFDSQSKERITNPVSDVAAHFSEIDFDKISKQILNTPEIVDPMIQAILYKRDMLEKLALAKKQKAVAKTRIVNHIIATDPDPEKRMLFIVEGLSALSNFLVVRNPKLHGALPLRGKVMNVCGMKPIEILKNKEIFELLTVLGLEFGNDTKNLNYGKIIVMVDADVDGVGSIQCLLLNLFSNWPELFNQNRIYRAMTPLYVCTKGNKTELFYNKTDFDKFNSKGWEVSYCKGLGTMSKEAYEQCINDPVLVQISANDVDLDMLEMAFGDDASKRKDWMFE